MKGKSSRNANRDLSRFVRMPIATLPAPKDRFVIVVEDRPLNKTRPLELQALSYVEVPLLHETDPGKRVMGKLPFLDPHELLNYLVSTGRVAIEEKDIRQLSCRSTIYYNMLCIIYIYMCI